MSLPQERLVPLVEACGLFMENLGSTVLATALPAVPGVGSEPTSLACREPATGARATGFSTQEPISPWRTRGPVLHRFLRPCQEP